MKSALQIGGMAALLMVLSLAPVRQRIRTTVQPELARAVAAVNRRFPTLVVMETLWRAPVPGPSPRLRSSQVQSLAGPQRPCDTTAC